jgi:hypothetical protein
MFPFSSGLKYRIRIFDNYRHVKTVSFKAMGQKYVIVTFKEGLFFGSPTKMAYMISPEVKPFAFGDVLEYNFDIRDAAPLASFSSLCPDLLKEINQDLVVLLADHPKDPAPEVIAASYTLVEEPAKKEEKIPASPKQEGPSSALDNLKENTAAIRQKANEIGKVTKNAVKLVKILAHFGLDGGSTDKERKQKIRDVIDLCSEHAPTLNWLPHYLGLDIPIAAIVGAIDLYRVGVPASYYAAQSTAEISQDLLKKPKEKMGWETVVLVIAVGGIIVLFGLLLLKAFGRI